MPYFTNSLNYMDYIYNIVSHNEMQDPVRSFMGREKYRRPLWITDALQNPKTVAFEHLF